MSHSAAPLGARGPAHRGLPGAAASGCSRRGAPGRGSGPGQLEAGDALALGGQPVVLARRPPARVRPLCLPLGVNQSLLLQPGKHRVQGAAGQPGCLHQVIAVVRCGRVVNQHPEHPLQRPG